MKRITAFALSCSLLQSLTTTTFGENVIRAPDAAALMTEAIPPRTLNFQTGDPAKAEIFREAVELPQPMGGFDASLLSGRFHSDVHENIRGNVDPHLYIGPYTLTGIIGSGGVGRVMRGQESENSTTVAIKGRFGFADAQAEISLVVEAAALAALSGSPYAPDFIALMHTREGNYRLAMEEVAGIPLSLYPEGRSFHPDDFEARIDDALEMTLKILDALGEQFRRGVVHGDLKPAQILYHSPTGMPESTEIKILDYGASFSTTLEKKSRRGSDSNYRAPTFGYAPPDHFGHNNDVRLVNGHLVGEYFWPDRTIDIHAVGLILYNLIRPSIVVQAIKFGHRTLTSYWESVVTHIYRDQNISVALKRLILTAMARNPSNRFQDAEGMQKAIRDLLHDRALARAT